MSHRYLGLVVCFLLVGGEATTVGTTVLLRSALFFCVIVVVAVAVVVVTLAVREGDAAAFFWAIMLVLGLGLCVRMQWCVGVGLLCRREFVSGRASDYMSCRVTWRGREEERK